MKLNNYYSLDNIKINAIDGDNFKEFCKRKIEEGSVNQVISMNLDSLQKSSKNTIYKSICGKAAAVIPDSIGVTSLISLKYNRKAKRLTGSEIFDILLKIADEGRLRIALIGSTAEVLRKTQEKIESMHKNLLIVATESPPQNFETIKGINEKTVDRIASTEPDIVIAALGCPRQEIWIANNMDSIGAAINIGLGAVFDFYSGHKKRAPLVFRKIGAEWVWRLVSEPKRLFKRYLIEGTSYFLRAVMLILIRRY